MSGRGAEFLEFSLEIIAAQTFTDFEVVISDQSLNEEILHVSEKAAKAIATRHIPFPIKRGNPSANLNNAIRNARGKLVKVLFQDDFLYDDTSLEAIVTAFDLQTHRWLVTASEHSEDGLTHVRRFTPRYSPRMHRGDNTISSPSVLTIKNDEPLLFDENLVWLMDCDYYSRCHEAFGPPLILDRVTVVNRIGPHQVTNTLADRRLKRRERTYMIWKHRLRMMTGPFRKHV
jgi:glycosyltransferase involved in cell wall biosynthesis